MRACTASPTEISYNHSDDPDELYRAEVEFITVDDWIKDLRALYSDLLDGNGEVSRECTNQDSDAGVAYAKIKAVYPKMTREMIASATPDALASQTAVRQVLGNVRKLRATTAASLYRQLQEYVDSKEKNTEKRMEFWPLIRLFASTPRPLLWPRALASSIFPVSKIQTPLERLSRPIT